MSKLKTSMTHDSPKPDSLHTDKPRPSRFDKFKKTTPQQTGKPAESAPEDTAPHIRTSGGLGSLRNIAVLLLISLGAVLVIYTYFGTQTTGLCDGPCESLYSTGTIVAAVALMLFGLIGAGALVGMLIAYLRSRARDKLFFDK